MIDGTTIHSVLFFSMPFDNDGYLLGYVFKKFEEKLNRVITISSSHIWLKFFFFFLTLT